MEHRSTTPFVVCALIVAATCAIGTMSAGESDRAKSSALQVPVRDLVVSGQAKFHVVSKKVHKEKTELEVVLVDNEGQSIGGYAPPYMNSQEEARPLWKDFVTANMAIPVHGEQMTIMETRKAEDQSFAIGFALDHSRSMTVPRALRMQTAIQQALRTFNPADYVSVVKFTGSVNREVDLTRERQQFLSKFKVNGLQSRNNGTAVYDAAMETIDQLAQTNDVTKRVMVLFTDGDDNSSSATLDEVIAKAKEHSVVIHGVVYGVANDAPIAKIAEETGGEVHRLSDVYDFDRVFLGIYNALRHSYTVTVKNNFDGDGDGVQGATMTAAGSSAGSVQTPDIMRMIPKGRVVIAKTPSDKALILSIDLHFARESHDVDPSDVALLDSLATLLIQRQDLGLEILNSSESVAEGDASQEFLQRRAQALRDLLIRRGVPPSRVQSYAGQAASSNTALRYADPKKTTFVITRL
jgi:outer membrane protein OmpA-like peptidoglycan-associated protein/Mg-chelatase subunit ChlD